MMFANAQAVHPQARVASLQDTRIETLALIVVPHPGGRRPQACPEADATVEGLAASILSMVSHLQIVAIQIPCVGALQYLVSALDACIPQEGDGLTFVPHPHDHRRIVIRVDGEWIGYTQHLQPTPFSRTLGTDGCLGVNVGFTTTLY